MGGGGLIKIRAEISLCDLECSHTVCEKFGNFMLGFPGLERFGDLPWWLGILLIGCKNVKILKSQ